MYRGEKENMVYIVFMLLGVLFTVFFGAVGYFICYLKQEKKAEKSKKKSAKYNPWNGIGVYL